MTGYVKERPSLYHGNENSLVRQDFIHIVKIKNTNVAWSFQLLDHLTLNKLPTVMEKLKNKLSDIIPVHGELLRGVECN